MLQLQINLGSSGADQLVEQREGEGEGIHRGSAVSKSQITSEP